MPANTQSLSSLLSQIKLYIDRLKDGFSRRGSPQQGLIITRVPKEFYNDWMSWYTNTLKSTNLAAVNLRNTVAGGSPDRWYKDMAVFRASLPDALSLAETNPAISQKVCQDFDKWFSKTESFLRQTGLVV